MERPVRLVAQDAGLSRRKQGFETPTGRHPLFHTLICHDFFPFFVPRLVIGTVFVPGSVVESNSVALEASTFCRAARV